MRRQTEATSPTARRGVFRDSGAGYKTADLLTYLFTYINLYHSAFCMPSHLFTGYPCVCACVILSAWYLTNRLWEFQQIYNSGAVGDKEEL